MDRDTFAQLMLKDDRIEIICAAFEHFGDIFKTESFAFILEDKTNGDVNIIDIASMDGDIRYINWYKLYHVGRCLKINNINDDELSEFIDNVISELRELLANCEILIKNSKDNGNSMNIETSKIALNSIYGCCVNK